MTEPWRDLSTGPRWARLVTEIQSPAVTVSLAVIGIGLYTLPLPKGLGYLALAFGLGALLPVALVLTLARLGVVESHHVRDRRERIFVLIALLIIESLTVVVLSRLGAPHLFVAMFTASLVGFVALAAVTPVIKASIHCGVFSVVAGVLSTASWALSGLLLLVGVGVGLARLAVKDHASSEVVAGLVIGFTAGGVAAWLLV